MRNHKERGVWWGWPSTKVGFHPTILTFGRMSKLFLLSLNRMVRPLSLAFPSPRGKVKAVRALPSSGTNDSNWPHGFQGDNLHEALVKEHEK